MAWRLEKTPGAETRVTVTASVGRAQLALSVLLYLTLVSVAATLRWLLDGPLDILALVIAALAAWTCTYDLAQTQRLRLFPDRAVVERSVFGHVIRWREYPAPDGPFTLAWPAFRSAKWTPKDPVRVAGSDMRLGAGMLSRKDAARLVDALNEAAASAGGLVAGTPRPPLRSWRSWLPVAALGAAYLAAPAMALQFLASAIPTESHVPGIATALLAPLLAAASIAAGALAILKRHRTLDQFAWVGPGISTLAICLSLVVLVWTVPEVGPSLRDVLGWRRVGERKTVTLSNGAVLTVPAGWRAEFLPPSLIPNGIDEEVALSPAGGAESGDNALVVLCVRRSRSAVESWRAWSTTATTGRDIVPGTEASASFEIDETHGATVAVARWAYADLPTRVSFDCVLLTRGHRALTIRAGGPEGSVIGTASTGPREALADITRLIGLRLPAP